MAAIYCAPVAYHCRAPCRANPPILIVEDEPGIADTLQYALRTDGFEPRWCATGEAALAQRARDAGAGDPRRRPARHQRLRAVQAAARAARATLPVRLPDRAQRRDRPRRRPRTRRRRLRRQAVLAARAGGARAQRPAPQRRQGDAPARRRQRPRATARSTVDEGRRQIRFYGRPLELSRYEYGLLKTLLSRPGLVFTRDALLDLVWDDASDSLDRTVDAHVKTLRAKLKAVAPELEPIRTPPRHGLRAGRRPAGRALCMTQDATASSSASCWPTRSASRC